METLLEAHTITTGWGNPKISTPNWIYWNHIRDAGLSIKAWLDVNDNNHDAVAEVLNAYVGWVQKVGN